MPTKTKHMVRKASFSEKVPPLKQIKIEPITTTEDSEMRVILDTTKVEEATKALKKIPKKPEQGTASEPVAPTQLKVSKEVA